MCGPRAKAAQSQAESQTPQVADSAAFRSGVVPVSQTVAGGTEAAKGPAQVQANADNGIRPPPGQEASKARSAAAPIEDARQGLGGGFIDQTYAAIDKADKRVSSGIDSVRSDTPGVSQAASVFRGVAGFVKDLGFGVARAAVMTSPTGQADTLFKDAELGAKVVNGEVTGRQVVDTAKAAGAAIVEPVTKPWNRGDRVEAGTRAVTEVGSLFLPASKAGLFGKLGKAANVADKANEVAKGTRLAETTKGEAAVNAGAKAEVPAVTATEEAAKAGEAGKPAPKTTAAEKAKPEGPGPKEEPKGPATLELPPNLKIVRPTPGEISELGKVKDATKAALEKSGMGVERIDKLLESLKNGRTTLSLGKAQIANPAVTLPEQMRAFSGKHDLSKFGFAPTIRDPFFEPKMINGVNRLHDAEAKILQQVYDATAATPNVAGKLRVVVSRESCTSCLEAAKKLAKERPNLQIELAYEP